MREHAATALPLAFLAMHHARTVDKDPTGAAIWEEIWSDNTPGSQAAIRLGLGYILK